MKNYAYRILILIGTQREFLQAIEKNIISLKDYKLFNEYILRDKWYLEQNSKAVYIEVKESTYLNYAFEWLNKPEYSSNKFFNLHNEIKRQIYNK